MTYLHRRLVDHLLLEEGVTFSVDGGGDEFDLVKSSNRDDIVAAIEAVHEAQILVHREGHRNEWALIIPHCVGPDETVVDYGGRPNGLIYQFMESMLRLKYTL